MSFLISFRLLVLLHLGCTNSRVALGVTCLSYSYSHVTNMEMLFSLDCPQVQVIHAYEAQEPDEINLEVGEIINILRKTADGKVLRLSCATQFV